ncbi:hypothetical protein DY000_02030013 [Brassica cretica]|uniref:Uncharacterized protein n=1 Tax=Brassica cretica TaxID=69181 RepID=A0ABQ7DQ79_BRACR|nr:hypothetical protein DY000_02030013 [Brassica cretica]
MAKGKATRDASTEESCNEMRKQRGKRKTRQNQQTMESFSSYEREHISQITKNQILKTKMSKDYRRQTNDEEDNIKDD